MIRFTDFIKVPNGQKTKIKFNMNAGNVNKPAWDLLRDDSKDWITMNAWKEKNSNHNLEYADYLIALAQYYPYGANYFVFGGIYKVRKMGSVILPEVGYELTQLDDYKEYIKRLIIKIEKPIGKATYNRLYEKVQEQLNPEVYEIAPFIKLGHFLGYQNTSLKHNDLQCIIKNEEPSWKLALSNVKGIYVITDDYNGQLYIGSASGNTDGIWQRWSNYADLNNLTGGNKGFNEILKKKGKQYIIDNFRYSILEIFDTKTKAETIINRENYWKKVFGTLKNGMNKK